MCHFSKRHLSKSMYALPLLHEAQSIALGVTAFDRSQAATAILAPEGAFNPSTGYVRSGCKLATEAVRLCLTI